MKPSLKTLHSLFDYEPASGKLVRIKSSRVDMVGAVAHHRQVEIFGKRYMTTHVIWAIVHGVWPKELIDHIDGDQTNNRLANLREATAAQNQWNKLHKGKLPTGVVFKSDAKRAKPWAVRFRWHGTKFHFGSYATKEEAIEVANRERAKLHGEFSSHVSRR